MTYAQYSIDWQAKFAGTDGSPKGTWLVILPDGFSAATTANYTASPAIMGLSIGIPYLSIGPVQFDGVVGPEVTGLNPTDNGFARLNLTTGRSELVAAYAPGDIALGAVRQGHLRIDLPGPALPIPIAYVPILPVYYVDGQNSTGLASDTNTGATALVPLRTGRELMSRLTWGGRQSLDKGVLINVLSQPQSGDDWSLDMNLVQFPFRIAGLWTLTQTVTLTAAKSMAQEDGTTTGWMEANGVDWATYEYADYICWNRTTNLVFSVHKKLTSTRAEVSQACSKLPFPAHMDDIFVATSPGTIAAGNVVEIYKLPRIPVSHFRCTGLYSSLFQHCAIEELVWDGSAGDYPGGIPINSLVLAEAGITGRQVGTRMLGESVEGQQLFWNSKIDKLVDYIGSSNLNIWAGCTLATELVSSTRIISFHANAIIEGQNAQFNVRTIGGTIHLSDCLLRGIIDVGDPAGSPYFYPSPKSNLVIQGLYGAVGTVRGTATFAIHSGGELDYLNSVASHILGNITLTVDEGANTGFAQYDDGSRTQLRTISWTNLATSVASGGFSNRAITRNGTVLRSVTLAGSVAGTGYPGGGPLAGDVTGAYGSNVVERIHGATVPISGALVTGNSLHVTGANTLTYSALNLAGGAGSVTGTLPIANLPNLAGDTTGAITANVVGKINGASVPAAGALTTGNSLFVTGTNTLAYAPLNLAGGVNTLTGLLPFANLGPFPYLALGTTPATTGILRIPAGQTIRTRDFINASDIDLIQTFNGSNPVIQYGHFGSGAGNWSTYLCPGTGIDVPIENTSGVTTANLNISGAVGASGTVLLQSTEVASGQPTPPFMISIKTPPSDLATKPITLRGQLPFAGATTNTSSGSILFQIQAAVGGGTPGTVSVNTAGNDVVVVSANKLEIKRGQRRHSVQVLTNYNVLVSDDIVSYGSITADRICTLPAAPTHGDQYTIQDTNGSCSNYTITVAGNTHNIRGDSTYVMQIAFESLTVQYDSTSAAWAVVA